MLTPRTRARKKNRDRQRRFRARRRLRLEEEREAANVQVENIDDVFPWLSSDDGGDEGGVSPPATPQHVPVEEPVMDDVNTHYALLETVVTNTTGAASGPPPPRATTPPRRVPVHAGVDVANNGGSPPPEPPPGVGPVQPDGDHEYKDGTWLARQLTKVKCFGEISETSMEKITRIFMDNLEDIAEIRRRGEVSNSYRHTIKKRLNIWQPGFKSAVKYIDLDDPTEEPHIIRDLQAIPRKFLNPTLNNHYRLIRTEAYTTLKDIKKHYESTHPHKRGPSLRNAYKKTAIGIDGVREANSGSRTLYVVTIMFDGCVFLWHIYNPYKGQPGAKPTLEELLR